MMKLIDRPDVPKVKRSGQEQAQKRVRSGRG